MPVRIVAEKRIAAPRYSERSEEKVIHALSYSLLNDRKTYPAV